MQKLTTLLIVSFFWCVSYAKDSVPQLTAEERGALGIPYQTTVDRMIPADCKRVVDGFLIFNKKNNAKLAEARRMSDISFEDFLEKELPEVKKILKERKTEDAVYVVGKSKAIALHTDFQLDALENVIDLRKVTVEISDNPREWTEADLTKLTAHSDGGRTVFDVLAFLSMHAKETTDANYTQRAKTAQHILAGYMPQKTGNVTQDLINFIDTIDAVNAKTWTKPTRVEYHKKKPAPQIDPNRKE